MKYLVLGCSPIVLVSSAVVSVAETGSIYSGYVIFCINSHMVGHITLSTASIHDWFPSDIQSLLVWSCIWDQRVQEVELLNED